MFTTQGQQGQPTPPLEWRETRDLRKQPTRAESAANAKAQRAKADTNPAPLARAYHPVGKPKATAGLPVGTQAKFITAAWLAYQQGAPINTLFTVHWGKLFASEPAHPLRAYDIPERVRHLVERIRKWLKYRGIPAHYIWVREFSDSAGEHWHLGLHLPQGKRAAFINFISERFEPAHPCPRGDSGTPGEFACAGWLPGRAGPSWHLAGDVPEKRRTFIGKGIAGYLGKGEPTERVKRGKRTRNSAKNYRPTARYDAPQGEVEGTVTRKYRFDISRPLKQALKRAGHRR